MSKAYSNVISLTKNSRGIYSLDPSIGCKSGMKATPGGCFHSCYAASSAMRYGFDFSNTVYRDFRNEAHRKNIVEKINRIPLDFVRMGTSGDPSEDWEHTIRIIKKIDKCNKQIVVITKHWTNLTQIHLDYLSTVNVCVNTSVSAIDSDDIIKNGVEQFETLKKYCKSVLRIVSARFNGETNEGAKMNEIQKYLFTKTPTLDTVLRVSKSNPLVLNDVILYNEEKFLGSKVLVSRVNKSTYFGKCSTCFEMCGLHSKQDSIQYPVKRGISKQLNIFKRKG